jgi:hypothetical protein
VARTFSDQSGRSLPTMALLNAAPVSNEAGASNTSIVKIGFVLQNPTDAGPALKVQDKAELCWQLISG